MLPSSSQANNRPILSIPLLADSVYYNCWAFT